MPDSLPSSEILQRRLDREKRAREEAERLLEEKSLELYEANRQLHSRQDELEQMVEERTAELQSALIRAQAATKAKSEFLAVMSHEIRTPLNAVIGISDLLSMEQLDAEHADQIELIQRSAQSLLELINDILDFSKIEAEQLTLETRDFSIARELEQWMATFRAQNQNPELELKLETNELPIRVSGDKTRLRQIIFNLVSNAIKFTQQGSVTLKANATEVENGWKLQVSVEDTGIGIAEETREKLFEPFSQANATISRKYGGTGLGLAISSRLAKAMGGSISCTSQVGKGSCFSFDIQLGTPSEQEVAQSPEDLSCSPSPMKVLVVEDNAINQMLACRMLDKLGHSSQVAKQGEDAIRMVQEESFDLLLMDFIMPGMDGLETTRRIRQLPLEPQPRIIALTANAYQDDMDAALEAGMDGFISKPVRLDKLRLELCRTCQSHTKPCD